MAFDPSRPYAICAKPFGWFKQDGVIYHPTSYEPVIKQAEPEETPGWVEEPEPETVEEPFDIEGRVEELMRLHHSSIRAMAIDMGLEPAFGPGSTEATARMIAEKEATDRQ